MNSIFQPTWGSTYAKPKDPSELDIEDQDLARDYKLMYNKYTEMEAKIRGLSEKTQKCECVIGITLVPRQRKTLTFSVLQIRFFLCTRINIRYLEAVSAQGMIIIKSFIRHQNTQQIYY